LVGIAVSKPLTYYLTCLIMRKLLWHLLCLLCILYAQSPRSFGQLMASSHDIRNDKVSPGGKAQPKKVQLKDFIKDFEHKFDISIAYQTALVEDVLIEPRLAAATLADKNAEDGLRRVLTTSKLKFRKSAEGYYVLYKDEEPAEKAAPSKPADKPETKESSALPVVFGITGTVKDKLSGAGIPGVTVLIKGSSQGTLTDEAGKYKLDIPDPNGFLVFSYIGYESQEVPVQGRSIVDITLAESVQALSEVVVTALGFKESADRTGVSNSKISSEAIGRSGEAGVINSLAGKASGVTITRTNGDPGAGSSIQIRGQNTITGSSQPLVIIDGIPMSNSSIGSNTGGVTEQSRLNDINPDDIESMQILKGASAAALWGSRAANGVIVITTKSGKNNNKINVSFKSTVSIDKVSVRHPMQEAYGQGSGGVFNAAGTYAWGDKIANRAGGADDVNPNGAYFLAPNGNKYYTITKKNSQDTFADSNFDSVFGTGHFWDNSLSLSGGSDKATFFFSLGNIKQQGIIRNNSDYKRTTVRFNTDYKFNQYIKLNAKTSYMNSFSNRIGTGSNVNGLFLGLLRTPPDFDQRDYKGDYYADSNPNTAPAVGRHRSYRRYLGNGADPLFNNPLWTINEQTNSSSVNRFLTSAEMVISPVKWFDLITRGGVDYYTDRREEYFPVFSAGGTNATGSYSERVLTEKELNLDVIGRATKDISENITGTYIVGFNINDRKFNDVLGTINNFLVANAPGNFSNALIANTTLTNTKRSIRSARLYATANLGFYDQVFLNMSLAGESASTFGTGSRNTFYYPSADVAWQFSNIKSLSKLNFLSFGKLRASYGVVGIQPEAYKLSTVYNSLETEGLSGSFYGNGALVQSGLQGNNFLRPEKKTEVEFGTDLRFFNNRFRTGITYYENVVRDLLLEVEQAPSTGFERKYANAAELENKGWEVDLSYDIIRKKDLKVALNTNWSRNRNKIRSLAGTESIQLSGFSTGASSRAVEGQPVGILWGGKFLRNEQDQLVLNENGFPQASPVAGIMGDPNPSWRGGMGASVEYKKFSFNILFETFQGAIISNATKGIMYAYGTHGDTGNEVTLSQPMVNYAGKTIPAGTTVRGNFHDFGGGQVLLDEAWYTTLGSGLGSVREQFTEDGSWTRLREVSFGYTLNSKKFREKTKLQSVDISVSGRNLYLWTKAVGIDPETNLTGVSVGRGLEYFNNPPTRSFLFTIKINY
jgi:TonB-linked SusC/RagA family outer membrane protein